MLDLRLGVLGAQTLVELRLGDCSASTGYIKELESWKTTLFEALDLERRPNVRRSFLNIEETTNEDSFCSASIFKAFGGYQQMKVIE